MEKLGLSKAEQTQERILAAATEEFAAYGVAGSRVDRIAKSAKANKSLIYDYFGSKDLLFKAVLGRHLTDVFKTIGFTADDLPGYAGRLFDYSMDHPYMMRLVMWNGLELSPEWPLDDAWNLKAQAKAVERAQRRGAITATYPPDFLPTLIVTLAAAWTTSNPFGTTTPPDTPERRAALRAVIMHAVEQLASPNPTHGMEGGSLK